MRPRGANLQSKVYSFICLRFALSAQPPKFDARNTIFFWKLTFTAFDDLIEGAFLGVTPFAQGAFMADKLVGKLRYAYHDGFNDVLVCLVCFHARIMTHHSVSVKSFLLFFHCNGNIPMKLAFGISGIFFLNQTLPFI